MHDKVNGQFHCNLAPLQTETELIELQSESLSNLFICDLVFWKQCKYVQLKNLAAKIYSCFSSTYTRTCEATFSALETIKSKHRCLLSDESLESLLILYVQYLKLNLVLQIIESSEFKVSN